VQLEKKWVTCLLHIFKYKIKNMRFVFKSSIPSATNAGTFLFVHEPNPNETLPTQYSAPAAGTLSNYDSHSVKALVPMAKIPDDFKGERNDHLDISPNLAVGPMGGFFMNDPNNQCTLVESSSGQFAIFIQDSHNIMGSSGFLPTQAGGYEIGSLFVEYDIEVEIAADNNNLAGGYSSFTSLQQTSGGVYVNAGQENTHSFSPSGGVLIVNKISAGTGWNSGVNSNGVVVSVQFDGTQEWFGFNEAGVYLAIIEALAITPADMGSTPSGYTGWVVNPIAGHQGSVLSAQVIKSTAISSGAGIGPTAIAILNVDDPLLDFFSPGTWTVGTGGSSTDTGRATLYALRVVSLPPQAVALYRKQLKETQREEKEFEDMKGKYEALIEEHVTARLRALLPPPDLPVAGESLETKEPVESKKPTVRAPGVDVSSWSLVKKSSIKS